MAVISAKLTSFTINNSNSNLFRCIGQYGTADLLNSGNTLNEEGTPNSIKYILKVQGLKGHTTKNIIIKSLLLNADGSLCTTKKFKIEVNGINTSVNLNQSDSVKLLVPTAISWQHEIEDDLDLEILIENLSSDVCYFCLHSVIINLQDVNKGYQVTFTGPLNNRNISTINSAVLEINRDSVDVSFTKDPINEYNSGIDVIEGRMYLRKDGIFVDGYLYGVAAIEATQTKSGLVKLSSNSFEVDLTDPDNPAIIAPSESGTAATPLLVFNVLATAKSYTDELVASLQELLDGIEAPLLMNIEDDSGEKQSLGEELTFSNDFEQIDNKLYIKWLEIN